jgi:hypothetical protein
MSPAPNNFVSPHCLDEVRKSWNLDKVCLIPFFTGEDIVKKVLAKLGPDYAPQNAELFACYVKQQADAGRSPEEISQSLKEWHDWREKQRSADIEEATKAFIPIDSKDILNLQGQLEKVVSMRKSYWGFTAVTLLVGASIAWLAASLLPLVIFAVASQIIYVAAIEDDYADALKETKKSAPLPKNEVSSEGDHVHFNRSSEHTTATKKTIPGK